MRRWYTEVGTKWIQKRLRPWAARLGEQRVEVEVRYFGFRWGSARPSLGSQRINIHWAAIHSLRPSSTSASPRTSPPPRTQPHSAVWSTVDRLMPNYQTNKTTLAEVGKIIWLGGSIPVGPSIHP